jgi:hypothetical protein
MTTPHHDTIRRRNMLRRLWILLACVGVALLAWGCEPTDTGDQEGAATATATGDEAEGEMLARAITLATAAREAPDAVEEALGEHDATVEDFEALMFHIAADPELSAQFEAAME